MFFFVLTFGSFAAIAAAQEKTPDDGIPPIVVAGMDAYKSKGPEEAVKAWIKGSAIDGSKEDMSQSNNLRQIQDFYGTFQGFDLISTRKVSARVRLVYLTLNFEKRPLFAKFAVYHAAQGWILLSFNFNTKEELILPANS